MKLVSNTNAWLTLTTQNRGPTRLSVLTKFSPHFLFFTFHKLLMFFYSSHASLSLALHCGLLKVWFVWIWWFCLFVAGNEICFLDIFLFFNGLKTHTTSRHTPVDPNFAQNIYAQSINKFPSLDEHEHGFYSGNNSETGGGATSHSTHVRNSRKGSVNSTRSKGLYNSTRGYKDSTYISGGGGQSVIRWVLVLCCSVTGFWCVDELMGCKNDANFVMYFDVMLMSVHSPVLQRTIPMTNSHICLLPSQQPQQLQSRGKLPRRRVFNWHQYFQ